MKKVNLITVLGISMFFSVGAFAQNGADKLPASAEEFINEYFPSVTVAKVEENSSWQLWEDEQFDVTLSNGMELDFDENGNIIEIDSPNNEAIPEEALPSEIVSYLEANYSGEEVISWEKKDNGQELELSNEIELEFDENGIFRKID